MKTLNNHFCCCIIILLVLSFSDSFSSSPSDSTFYILNETTVKHRNDIYLISSVNPEKTIENKLTFASVEYTDKTSYGSDTILILSDSVIIYLNKLISVKHQPFKVSGFIISNSGELEQPLPMMQQTRNNAMNFFKMMQKLGEPSTVSFIPFDRTNVIRGVQKKPFILNANIQTPMALGGYRWNIRNSGILVTAQLVPQFMVRIFQDDPSVGDTSRPVRTPSYMPGGTFFFTHEKLWNSTNTTNHYVGVKLFHHSNGQDGHEFDGDNVNIYNGNFGEDMSFEFFYGGYYTTVTRVGINVPKKIKTYRIYAEKDHYLMWSWRAGFEYHPYSLTTDYFKQLNLYGRKRLNINANLMKIARFNRYLFLPKLGFSKKYETKDEEEKWRLSINMSYITDVNYSIGNALDQTKVNIAGLKNRMNIYLTAYRPFRGTPYTALFVQAGYYSSDPYNIYFQNRMWFLRAGVALHFFNLQ